MIHFWGLTCGPCLVELPQWGKLQAERPDMRLVLIAADPAAAGSRARDGDAGACRSRRSRELGFTDRFYERLRYEIDPAWAGELPRTVMIDGDGKTDRPARRRRPRPGAPWLDAQSKARL